jgi:hypothetical protein
MPTLENSYEYQKDDEEWTIGVIQNTTDIYIQRRKRICNSISPEIIGDLIIPEAADELKYIGGTTCREKYLHLLEYNMKSQILRPHMEPVVGSLTAGIHDSS